MSTRLKMKTITSSLLFAGALISMIAVVITFGTPGVARAQTPAPTTCGVYTLHGFYLFATHGFNIVGAVAQPKAIVEGIDFHGDGTLSVPFATVSINGNIIQPPPGGGVYTVDADCTGTLTFSSGIGFAIFVQPNGRQLWMIQTNPNTVFEGTATRVPH